MRPRTWVYIAPLALALAADVAPGACEAAWPAPPDFVVEIRSGFSDYVYIAWTADPTVHDGLEFHNYRLERRDDTAGSEFASIYIGTFQSSGLFTQGIADPSQTPSCIRPEGCVEPGHTYTFRVMVEFAYDVTCPQYDGQQHFSAPSTATLVVPGGGASGAPKDVLAIGETKSQRVTLTWTPPTPAPADYVIRRREIDVSPAKGGKAATAFELLAHAKAAATKFIDKSVERDKAYEYVVEAIEDGAATVSASQAEPAYGPSMPCPASDFDLWNGTYQFDDESGKVHHRFTLASSHGKEPFHAKINRLNAQGASAVDGVQVDIAGNGSPFGSTDAKSSVTIDSAETLAGVWGTGLPLLAVGGLGLTFGDRDQFDVDAFRRIEGDMLLKTGKHSLFRRVFDAVRVPADPDNGVPRSRTSLCATVGASSSTVKEGKEVVIVYQLRCLGPAPLYCRRAALEITVTNGYVVSAAGGWFEMPQKPELATHLLFPIGALGPVSATRSEVASLILKVNGVAPAAGLRQLVVELKVVTDARDFPDVMFNFDEDVAMKVPVRRVELAIAKE